MPTCLTFGPMLSTAPLWHLTIQIKGGLEEAQGDAP